MINHARTLLLNVAGETYTPDTLGEEYIPPYKPVTLSTHIQTARRILFGSAPDRLFLNFRAHELLSLIHNTELAEFVYALDPRVTYWPREITDFYELQKKINVSKISGINAKLYTYGEPESNIRRGRLFDEYSVRLLLKGGLTRIVIVEAGRGEILNEAIEVPAPTLGLSPIIQIPNSAVSVQISDSVTPIGYMLLEQSAAVAAFLLQESAEKIELETDTTPEILPLKKRMQSVVPGDALIASWNLKTYARPDSAVVTCLPLLELLGEPLMLTLFGVNPAEPYATFKNIWRDSKDPSYRLSAFVLALIYRTNELYYGN